MIEEKGNIKDILIEEEMKESYLTFAMSVIMSRALPDVRDGLKPSQRRILVAMNDLNLGPTAKFRKCAKVVGDVMGSYHPHGDSAIYDALVRLAQPFATRLLLVEGKVERVLRRQLPRHFQILGLIPHKTISRSVKSPDFTIIIF